MSQKMYDKKAGSVLIYFIQHNRHVLLLSQMNNFQLQTSYLYLSGNVWNNTTRAAGTREILVYYMERWGCLISYLFPLYSNTAGFNWNITSAEYKCSPFVGKNLAALVLGQPKLHRRPPPFCSNKIGRKRAETAPLTIPVLLHLLKNFSMHHFRCYQHTKKVVLNTHMYAHLTMDHYFLFLKQITHNLG